MMRRSPALSTLEAVLGGQVSRRRPPHQFPPLLINERYQVEKILGTGAFGVVLLVRDTRIGRQLALKCIPAQDPAAMRDYLAQEALALGKVEAPQVVQAYDCFATHIQGSQERHGVVVIAMEYIQGLNLREWASRKQRTLEERLSVLVAAARGLEAVHAVGVIHRDFKPENVLVTRSCEVRLVDFGLAYQVKTSVGSKALARRGDFGLGTPEYMAPEVYEGIVGPAADQYSFALTAWELLTGTRPFEAQPTSKSSELLDYAGFKQLTGSLARTLGRALEVASDKRYGSITELREALEHSAGKFERLAGLLVGTLALGAVAATAYHVGKQSHEHKK